MIADGLGRAIAFRVAPGQAHELPQAILVLLQFNGERFGAYPASLSMLLPFYFSDQT